MTPPTKPEPTQADREKAVEFHAASVAGNIAGAGRTATVKFDIESHFERCDLCKHIASELVAVRDEASPKMCPECGHRCIPPTYTVGDSSCPHCKALHEAHTAGAAEGEAEWHADGYKVGFHEGGAEMVERCAEKIEERCEYRQAYKNRRCRKAGENRCRVCRQADELRNLSPNPNYLAEMRAGVREECAEIIDKHSMCSCNPFAQEKIDDPDFHFWACAKASLQRIRSLDPNHSDVLEGMKEKAVLGFLRERYPITGGPSIAWSVMLPFDDQCKRNHSGQDLKEIAGRGGLSALEAVCIVNNWNWYKEGRKEWKTELAAKQAWRQFADHHNEQEQRRLLLTEARALLKEGEKK